MKKVCSVVFSLALTVIFAACMSAGAGQILRAAEDVKKSAVNQFLEKKLTGIGKRSEEAFVFHKDFTLTVIKGEKKYSGTWTFNKNAPLYPFTISWQEEGKASEYIVDFVSHRGQPALIGRWTVTDATKTLSFKFTAE